MTKSLLASPPLLVIAAIASSTAFIIPSSTTSSRHQSRSPINPTTSTILWPSSPHQNPSIINPTRSKSTQLHSLFGLGPAELAIIGIAAIFLIGPSKLTEFTRSAGEVAGKEAAAWKEIKNIPEEFQKGLEEGEIEGRSKKAKVMEKVDEE
jgi:sec-independent protein translocase protein TatA